ncbi:hypothetical protein AVEN_93137-1 [Araneus ventricosus]|uniref:Pre-C2HC domain-containing protein n=1 Tax=Araneus ventricosus TaxID=182803 RepID=A0A4Y2IIJ4_ARAVE|nr:hypothetical protein AVEN_93137-1 [Araneus ventricosus]
MKRLNSPIKNDDGTMKKQKYAEKGPCSDGSKFKIESERKSSVEFPTRQMDFLMDTHVSRDTENLGIPAVKPLPIVVKGSKNSEADIKLINEKFGELRRKKAGTFTKIFPDSDDMHRDLITFLKANNIKYIAPKRRGKARRIKVVITGLPCDMRTKQIKKALVEKDLDVERIVQVKEYRTEKPLPLFKAFLPNSDRNKNIFNLTDLLNLNISVVRIPKGKSGVRHTQENFSAKSEADVPKCLGCGETGQIASCRGGNKCDVEHTYEKGTTKSEADIRKCKDCGETGQVASCLGSKKSRKLSKNNLRKEGSTHNNMAQVTTPLKQETEIYQELPRLKNITNESEPSTDLQDILYIIQELTKLFGKVNDIKSFAQKLRNAVSSVEKLELFSAVFLD